MGEAIGETLVLAVAVALSPIPIIAVVLILTAPGGAGRGVAFVAGCLAGMGLVGAIVLVVAPGGEDDGGPPTWISLLRLALGVLLVLLAVKQWRSRPRGDDEPPLPGWLGAIDGLTTPKAFVAGALASGANPKNVLLGIAAATTIAQTGIPGGEQAAAYAVFAVLGTLGVALPVVLALALGDRATPLLGRLRTWLGHNNAVIVAVILLVIGVKLVGDAITGFSV
jgi:threonine/homoserine/homoserine lactone efflux protein